LKDTGFIEGETVPIEYGLAENQIERLLALATELVRRQVAAIAGPITSALVARAATTNRRDLATAFFREPPDAFFVAAFRTPTITI
jgi:anaerobic C4-dicarboxylate transporter